MRKFEAVIFDWAGTTVDFGSMAPVQAFVAAFQRFGITPTVEEVRKPMGMLKWDHVHTMLQMDRISSEWERVHGRAWEKADVDEVYGVSETSILDILKDFAEPKPFVLEAVNQLRERGIKIGSTTGYTRQMMEIVTEEAKKRGYAPDAYFTPDMTENKGRPYPYMVFRNLEALNVSSVNGAIKVGDTAADIKEGKNAGLISVGVVEGSSVMGLSEEEYDRLTREEKDDLAEKARAVYRECGADYVIDNFSQLPALIEQIERDSRIF